MLAFAIYFGNNQRKKGDEELIEEAKEELEEKRTD